VSGRRRGGIPHEPRFKTANEEWKARWNDLLAWSTVLAVAIHAAAFAFWPSWDTLDLSLEPDLELLATGTAWIPFYAEPMSGGSGGNDGGGADDRAGGNDGGGRDDGRGGGGELATTSLALEEPASIPVEEDAGIGGSEPAQVALQGGLQERLLGRGRPVPTIVEPGPASAPPDLDDDPPDTYEADTQEEPEKEDVRVIVKSPTIVDLALRLETSSLETSTLDLSQLSGDRPELLMPGTSAWLLIQNPERVEEFMRVIAQQQDPEAQGQVDVAVWIDDRGSVEWSEVTRSSGLEEMDEIALALFTEVASFQPARDRGVRVSLSAIFTVAFPW
jgi:TonB family protein